MFENDGINHGNRLKIGDQEMFTGISFVARQQKV